MAQTSTGVMRPMMTAMVSGVAQGRGMSRTLLKMPRLALLFERYAASARRSTVGVVV
jgi:hypothetical protein